MESLAHADSILSTGIRAHSSLQVTLNGHVITGRWQTGQLSLAKPIVLLAPAPKHSSWKTPAPPPWLARAAWAPCWRPSASVRLVLRAAAILSVRSCLSAGLPSLTWAGAACAKFSATGSASPAPPPALRRRWGEFARRFFVFEMTKNSPLPHS